MTANIYIHHPEKTTFKILMKMMSVFVSSSYIRLTFQRANNVWNTQGKNSFAVRALFAQKNQTILNVWTEKVPHLEWQTNEWKSRAAIPCEIRPAHGQFQVALVWATVHLRASNSKENVTLTRSLLCIYSTNKQLNKWYRYQCFSAQLKHVCAFRHVFCRALAHLVYITRCVSELH